MNDQIRAFILEQVNDGISVAYVERFGSKILCLLFQLRAVPFRTASEPKKVDRMLLSIPMT